MKRYSLFLKPEQLKRLQKLFEETGMRPAEAIRRAIDAYLDAKKVKR
jgi:predicted DNA-binding protein